MIGFEVFSFLVLVILRDFTEFSRLINKCHLRVCNNFSVFFSLPFLQIRSYMKDLMIFSAGKFRHLPVVENGEVIAMLDIAKCLYDSISRMEKAAERGSAIAAAVESVERQWGSTFSG